eukprot:6633334-Heterocapsa_arctica.AAC.1
MACRSAAFVTEVRDSAVKRGLKPVASLENPPIPDDPDLPSSFYLSAVDKFVSEGEVEDFNTCIYGPPLWKPARWAGA